MTSLSAPMPKYRVRDGMCRPVHKMCRRIVHGFRPRCGSCARAGRAAGPSLLSDHEEGQPNVESPNHQEFPLNKRCCTDHGTLRTLWALWCPMKSPGEALACAKGAKTQGPLWRGFLVLPPGPGTKPNEDCGTRVRKSTPLLASFPRDAFLRTSR